jgi:hypothetical protein
LRTEAKQVARTERAGSVGDMMQRSSSKQLQRGWFAHTSAAAMLREDNCIPGMVVPG